MWLNICFSIVGFGVLAVLFLWWRIAKRSPKLNIVPEHHAPGYRAWEHDSVIPHPNYHAIMRLLAFLAIVLIIAGGYLGFRLAVATKPFASVVEVVEDVILEPVEDWDEIETELIDNLTPTPETTLTATATETVVITTIDSSSVFMFTTATPYPTYTPFPTYTPYPSLTPHLLIVTPVDQRPTSAPYVPQAQESSYGRLVPDQRGQQQQQVYQQPQQYYQQPQYIYPTAQFVIPRWEDYITSTPRPSATYAPTQTPYIVVVTNTPNPTATEITTYVPTLLPPTETLTPTATETPMPTFTPTPTATATFEPSPTPILPTATDEPTLTPIPTETPETEEIIPDEPADDH